VHGPREVLNAWGRKGDQTSTWVEDEKKDCTRLHPKVQIYVLPYPDRRVQVLVQVQSSFCSVSSWGGWAGWQDKIPHRDFAFLARRQMNNLNLIVIAYYSKSLICIYPNKCPIPEPNINLVFDQSLNTDRKGTHVYQR